MDRLAALRLFVLTVETGAIGRAAGVLGLSQPAASRALTALEADLGARLLQRSTRRLSLTEAGRLALERARAVLAEADGLEAAVRGFDRAPAGLLRIGASTAFGRRVLGPMTGAFLRLHPHVRLDFLLRDDRVDPAAEAVDLTFRLGPLPDSPLTARRLASYERMLVAAPGHPPVTDPAALAGVATLDFSGARFGRRWPLTDGRRTVEVEIAGQLKASSGGMVLDLARQGLGVALLPAFLVQPALERGDLARVLPAWRGPELELHALWSAPELPRRARVYLEFVAARLRLAAA